jgi:hypothetical protein
MRGLTASATRSPAILASCEAISGVAVAPGLDIAAAAKAAATSACFLFKEASNHAPLRDNSPKLEKKSRKSRPKRIKKNKSTVG